MIVKSGLALQHGGHAWSRLVAIPVAWAYTLRFPTLFPTPLLVVSPLRSRAGCSYCCACHVIFLMVEYFLTPRFAHLFTCRIPEGIWLWDSLTSGTVSRPYFFPHRTHWRRDAWLWPVDLLDGSSRCRRRHGVSPGPQWDVPAPHPGWEMEEGDEVQVGLELLVQGCILVCARWASAARPLRLWPL